MRVQEVAADVRGQQIEMNALGFCTGRRPWLGPHANEDCKEHSRLLVRTASNAYFPQVVSVLSLPDRGSEVERVVRELWDDLQTVETADHLEVFKRLRRSSGEARSLHRSSRSWRRSRTSRVEGRWNDRSRKWSWTRSSPLPRDTATMCRSIRTSTSAAFRTPHGGREAGSRTVQAVFQLHRLREVIALAGFTRFEAVMPDINGEYDTDVERAAIQVEPTWFPAVENRGEGVFVQLRPSAVSAWLKRPGVIARLSALESGHASWAQQRKSERPFPGGPYVLLHTLSHLLIQAFSMRAGYSASSIRERIYSDPDRVATVSCCSPAALTRREHWAASSVRVVICTST